MLGLLRLLLVVRLKKRIPLHCFLQVTVSQLLTLGEVGYQSTTPGGASLRTPVFLKKATLVILGNSFCVCVLLL